ncbi:MAG: ATP-binding protein [Thermodesulfovibrionales bacterium]
MPSKDKIIGYIKVILRPGLQRRFILFTGISIIGLMAILGFIAVQREREILYQEVEREGRLLGETLAIPIINDLIYERLGLIEEGGLLDNYIIEIFQKKDINLLYIAILDETGRVLSHNDITEYGKTYNDSITLRALNSEVPLIQKVFHKNKPAIDFSFPLSIGKKRWGTLKFGISLEKVKKEVTVTVLRIVLLTIIFLIAGFGIIVLLSQRFIRPITELANTMESIRGEELDVRMPVRGLDEIAVLTERFNSLMERIRNAQIELRKTHERLMQSERLASIGILAAGIAHEINNPLGGLFNCLEILKQKGGDPLLREKYLSLIREGLERIETTVNRLLYMARKREPRQEEINVKDAVDTVYGLVEFRGRKLNIKFRNDMPEDFKMVIDPQDFQQILLNLFINAVQAMKEGGELRVSGSRNNSSLIINVSDTGSGIKKEHLPRLFDPFFTTKPPGEGTGLGLWLTYEIVKSYNGDINVESEEGKGSTFRLIFPVREYEG